MSPGAGGGGDKVNKYSKGKKVNFERKQKIRAKNFLWNGARPFK